MNQSYCQQLTDAFNGLRKRVGEIEVVMSKAWIDLDESIAPQLEPLFQQQNEIQEAYQRQAREMVKTWFGNQYMGSFIRFEKTGRVVITRDVTVGDKSYFPSLIRAVEGTLDLSILSNGALETMDFLEETEDISMHNSQLKSAKRLKHVHGYVTSQHSRLQALESLETVDGHLSLRSAFDFKGLPKLRTCGGINLEDTQVETLDALMRVNGVVSLARAKKFRSAKNLQSISDILHLQGTTITSFADTFPALRSIGTDAEGTSVVVSSKSLETEIEALKTSHDLSYDGVVRVQ